MINEILIFRTDRIGDLLISCPAVLSLKEKIKDSRITLITSKYNYDYARSLNIFDDIRIIPRKNFIEKIKFIKKLSKIKFDYIFIFDGKERSIITSIFIKSKIKTALMQKKRYNFLYNFLGLKLIDDDNKTNLVELYQKVLDTSNLNIKISNFDFLKIKKNNGFSSNILTKNYILIHLDEKWIKSLYINKYKSINPTYQDFINFLKIISQKNEILITTGLVNYNLIDDIKNNFFKKVNEKIYFKDINNKKIYLIFKPSLDDIESLIANAKTLISCHGAITHIANSYDIEILDIIDESKKNWYPRFSSYMSNYNFFYRNNFDLLSKEIISKI